jgi:pimeloyl-ACP methyl ester carboxylesterase
VEFGGTTISLLPGRRRPLVATAAVFSILTALLLLGCQTSQKNSVPTAQQKLTVDGHPLNAMILGGSPPVVVFESAMGESLKSWAAVIPEIAPSAACFAYDRAGIGKSKSGHLPRDGRTIAKELHLALHNAHLPPPYILISHSSGAFYSQLFASIYPEEVASLLFIEPATIEFFDVLKRDFPNDYQIFTTGRDDTRIPENVRSETSQWDTTVEEIRGLPAPKVPITVITAEKSWIAQRDLWWQSHEDLLTNSPAPRHYFATAADHYVQVAQPALVAQAILELVNEYRNTHSTATHQDLAPAPPELKNP